MTKNAIDKQRYDEDVRHNKATEAEAARTREQDLVKHRETIGQKERERGTKRMLGLGQIAMKGVGDVGKMVNDFSFYDKFDPSLSNDLKLAITSYAGKGEHCTGDEAMPSYDINTRPNWWPTSLNRDSWMYKAGVFAYKVAPYIGDGGTGETPCNIAVRTFNSIVRAANSGPATNYDSVDLFMMPLACDSIVSIMAWAERGIELAKLVNPRDINTKEYGILKAHSYGNANLAKLFLNNTAELIQILNRAKVQYNALNLPYEFDYVKRHVFLFGNYFKDGDGVGANYHVCNPYIYWVYDETNGKLVATRFDTPAEMANNFSFLTIALNSMISALLDSQTVAIMSGDMQKAFGSKISQMPLLDLSDISYAKRNLTPITDVKYLQSFKNATICSFPTALTQLDVAQKIVNANPYLYQGDWSGTYWQGIKIDDIKYTMPSTDALSNTTIQSSYMPENSKYLDFYDSSNITEEDVLYNLSFFVSKHNNRITDMRSEFIVCMDAYLYDIDDNNNLLGTSTAIRKVHNDNIIDISSTNSTLISKYIDKLFGQFAELTLFAQFNFIPRITSWVITQNSSNVFYLKAINAWNRNVNRRKIEYSVVDRVQLISLASMFFSKETLPSKDFKSARRTRK